MNPFYTDYSAYISRFFPGEKVQKISVNTASGCPNRDGTIGRGGCIYCSNASFTPSYCLGGGSVGEQLEAGKKFFARKYPKMKYLAYFQSYTSTHGLKVEQLAEQYEEAISTDGVVGLAVSTRPDCLPGEVVELLAEINHRRPVFVELGVETMSDETLRLIRRGHTADQVIDAITRAAAAGLHVGAHLIAGLPGEDADRTLANIKEICKLPVESLKIHHLQVIRATPLADMIEEGEISVNSFTPEEYLDLCVRIVDTVPKGIAIERFLASAPPEMVIAPRWGLKNYEFTNLLINRLQNRKKINNVNPIK